MDSSRRAVESYWRSRMIDGATSDEEKVTLVHKLEEICEFLRSSHASIVKEVFDFILKRIDHKSPVVKQKMNYCAMGNLIAQHLTTMSSFQHLGNMNMQNTDFGNVAGTNGGGYTSPLPDIFQPNFPISLKNPTSSSNKDDTRAFDFISDHVAATRDSKRVV